MFLKKVTNTNKFRCFKIKWSRVKLKLKQFLSTRIKMGETDLISHSRVICHTSVLSESFVI